MQTCTPPELPSLACAHVQVVLLLDADFVVSTGLHEKLSSATEFAALIEDTAMHHSAIVLPAFETEASLGMEQGSAVASQAQASESRLLVNATDSHMVQSLLPAGRFTLHISVQ